MKTTYISIGNSDGKLGPAEWTGYWQTVNRAVVGSGFAKSIQGIWHSLVPSEYVNACWCVELYPEHVDDLRELLRRASAKYHQDSVAWAVAKTEFLKP